MTPSSHESIKSHNKITIKLNLRKTKITPQPSPQIATIGEDIIPSNHDETIIINQPTNISEKLSFTSNQHPSINSLEFNNSSINNDNKNIKENKDNNLPSVNIKNEENSLLEQNSLQDESQQNSRRSSRARKYPQRLLNEWLLSSKDKRLEEIYNEPRQDEHSSKKECIVLLKVPSQNMVDDKSNETGNNNRNNQLSETDNKRKKEKKKQIHRFFQKRSKTSSDMPLDEVEDETNYVVIDEEQVRLELLTKRTQELEKHAKESRELTSKFFGSRPINPFFHNVKAQQQRQRVLSESPENTEDIDANAISEISISKKWKTTICAPFPSKDQCHSNYSSSIEAITPEFKFPFKHFNLNIDVDSLCKSWNSSFLSKSTLMLSSCLDTLSSLKTISFISERDENAIHDYPQYISNQIQNIESSLEELENIILGEERLTLFKQLLQNLTNYAQGRWDSHALKRRADILIKSSKKRKKSGYNFVDGDMDDFIVSSSASDIDIDYGSQDDKDKHQGLQSGKAILLCGPTGIGKSHLIQRLIAPFNFQLIEIDPGMKRTQKDILSFCGEALKSKIISKPSMKMFEKTCKQYLVNPNKNEDKDGKRMEEIEIDIETDNDIEIEDSGKNEVKPVLLFENVDILFEKDRGFWTAIENLVSMCRVPIFMTCEEYPFRKENASIPPNLLSSIIDQTHVVHFKPVPSKDLASLIHYCLERIHQIHVTFNEFSECIDKAFGCEVSEIRQTIRQVVDTMIAKRNIVNLELNDIDNKEEPKSQSISELTLEQSSQYSDCASDLDILSIWVEEFKIWKTYFQAEYYELDAFATYPSLTEPVQPPTAVSKFHDHGSSAFQLVEDNLLLTIGKKNGFIYPNTPLSLVSLMEKRFNLLDGMYYPAELLIRKNSINVDVLPYLKVMCKPAELNELHSEIRTSRRKKNRLHLYEEEFSQEQKLELLASIL